MASSHGGNYVPGSSSPTSTHQSSERPHGGNYIPGSVQQPEQVYNPSENYFYKVQPQYSGQSSNQQPPYQQPPYKQSPYQQSPYQQYPPQEPQTHFQGQPPYQAPYNSHGITQYQPATSTTAAPNANSGKSAGVFETEHYIDNTGPSGSQYTYGAERSFIPLKGYKHIFSPQAFRLFKHPHFYKPASNVYTSVETFRDKDAMLRFREGVLDDRYISPCSGRNEELVVQAVDNIYLHGVSEGTWNRTFVRDISPWHLRLANWPESHIHHEERIAGLVTRRQKWLKAAKYVPAAIALITVIMFPGNVEGEIRNGGRYDAFPYRFHGYSKVARNLLEEKIARKHSSHNGTHAVMINRLLMPRKLCYIDCNPTPDNPDGIQVEDVGEGICEPYLFVAYTAEQFPDRSPELIEKLVRMAAQAARDHDLKAFWIACCCMDMDSNRVLAGGTVLQEDVYRISDVIRGAKALVIMVGPSQEESHEYQGYQEQDTIQNERNQIGRRLRQWGRRVWTFPEVLLSPSNKAIRVYDSSSEGYLELEKNQFAQMVWPDKHVSRQLIDHYEGNLQLSRLELVILALECLHSRQHGKMLDGDHAYALMGLLRVRPEVDETDSGFQAFARLSLANDSDSLLERLACVLPRNPDQPWYSMEDAYDTKLWDINPSCQTAGIGDDNTIILDGARGANVRWKSFASVHVLRRWSWTRVIFRILLHTSSLAFIIAVVLECFAAWIKRREKRAAEFFMGPFDKHDTLLTQDFRDDLREMLLYWVNKVVSVAVDIRAIKAWAVLFFLWSIPMMCFAPIAIKILYGGKLWNTQPWLFGFEGYLPIEQIEFLIFGDHKGRLRWHPFGSPLSRHQPDESWKGGHCDPVDPTTDPEVRAMVEAAKTSKLGDPKIFTLVDTNTMTVTMFQAARPPVCFLLLGGEGGMQRAVGCSYDWTTGILYRETVLRMETSCIDKMDLVSRARISLEKRIEPAIQLAPPRTKAKMTFTSEKFANRKKSATEMV